MSNIEQQENIKALRKQLAEIQKQIREIERNCKHVIVQVGAAPKYNDEGSAVCEDCGTWFGWWCPDSPDHTCHYHSYEIEAYLLTARAVELIDGDEHIFYDYKGDPQYETDDECLFCGDPDERK